MHKLSSQPKRGRWPHFGEDEIAAVVKVLDSGKVNYWTGDIHTLADGTRVRGENGLFEYEFARYIGTDHAIALANGSLALELALYALGIGNGDEVIVPNRTFIATASACVMRGAVPVFADIDPDSQNLTLDTIEQVFTAKTRAIICVHLAGRACEMDEIMAFAAEHQLKIIEDCAQCVGGKYKNRMLGAIGHAAAFSFCQDKIITTGGEGGMFVCSDPEIYKKAWAYKDHGKDFDKYNRVLGHPLVKENTGDDSSYYTSLGTNWRMTEMQAAIGRIQLRKLPEWLTVRRRYAAMLDEAFSKVPGLRVVIPPPHIFHAYYKYYVFIEPDKLKPDWNRDRIIAAVNAEGVTCQFGSTWGIGLQSAWRNAECPISGKTFNCRLPENLPGDFLAGTTILMFQVHPTLHSADIRAIIQAVEKVIREAGAL
ncbi:MAG: DegT/DnrJ/EryC1/StrS aminotransferase family protein [Victivallales bacterium]|nr:DegT/DnrJ/EryC1/StrS aminotransferase family protein [Victivallales bacterium]